MVRCDCGVCATLLIDPVSPDRVRVSAMVRGPESSAAENLTPAGYLDFLDFTHFRDWLAVRLPG